MKKYKIGYTTGVFDMFHIGHLNILRKAKDLCDFLIVGVSTDELVQSYKAKTPIISFEERKQIVEAIKYVDKVIAQSSMDKIATVNTLKYDVVFVGSDWKGTKKWIDYEKEFNAHGVDVIYLEHTDGISSTILREKLGDGQH